MLSKRCPNEELSDDRRVHLHASRQEGQAETAERYPPELITMVLKALRMQLRLGGAMGALEVGPTVEEEELVQSAAKGGQFKDVLDRVTG